MRISSTLTAAVLAVLACQAASAQQASLHYAGGMRIEPERGSLSLDWRIAVQDDERDSITFFLSAAFPPADIGGASVLGVERETVDGFAGPMTAYTVSLAAAEPSQLRVIEMQYGGILLPEPLPNRINTVNSEKVELTVDSFWMPFDSRFSSLVTAEIDIAIDGNWSGVGIENLVETEFGFRLTQTRPVLDVAFTLMSRFQRSEADDYVVYDLRSEPGAGIESVTGALSFCTAYLNRLAGQGGPLPRAAVTITDRESAGYSRATLIALTDIRDSDPDALTQFICHELGHYWSRGNPMTVENWLNESFADYVALMGMRERHGDAAFVARLDGYRAQIAGAETPPPAIWTPGAVARPAYLVAYRKGPVALALLEEQMGRDQFEAFISATMQRGIETTPDMLDLLEDLAGPDMRAFFEAELAR